MGNSNSSTGTAFLAPVEQIEQRWEAYSSAGWRSMRVRELDELGGAPFGICNACQDALKPWSQRSPGLLHEVSACTSHNACKRLRRCLARQGHACMACMTIVRAVAAATAILQGLAEQLSRVAAHSVKR